MSGIKDTATVTLNVNGAQAKQMMSDLEAKIKQTEATISSLKANMADPKDVEKARKQLKTYQKQLDEMKSATEGVNKALGNLDVATPRQLEKALRTLNKQLKDMEPGSKVWNEHVQKIKELKERLAEIREELTPQETLWGKFKNWINDSGAAILALGLGFDQVISTLRGYVDAYAEMDAEMANVRKFTGMTAEQVAALNEEFKKIDTRTSREDLNKLAQEAGRLGKTSAEDVLGFVRAADQINVALDDLGEGATLTLSKLTNIFGDEAIYGTEQSLLKVGSVINELSQNCSASAPYLAQFAQRMGGVGAQANMTIPQIMGFAAVLDSNAQAVEASSTALSQVIVRMMQDPAKYAEVAGLEVENFTRLLKEDTNSALILFLDTLQKAGGMDVLSPMFKDMGENGSRAIAALSTLATHIDQVKAQQEAANVAFEEGTSVTQEFNVQNTTVQASLDKCKNAAHELQVELGERLQPLMSHLLTSGSAIMRMLLSTIRFVSEHKAAIISLAAAVAAYLVVINREILIKKVRNAIDTIHYGYLVLESKATKSLAVVTEGLRLVYFRLTGQTTKAMVAQKAFSAAMSATPWGAILTAVSAALVAFQSFDDELEETKIKYEALDNAKKDAAQRLGEERVALQLNIDKIKSFNGTKTEEQQIIHTLNEKYGPILGTYSTLSDWLTTLTTHGNEYCQSLYQQMIMEGKLEQARQLIAEAQQNRDHVTYTPADWYDAFVESTINWKFGDFSWTSVEDINQRRINEQWQKNIARAEELEARAQALIAEANQDAERLKANAPTVDISSNTPPPSVPPSYTPSTTRDRFSDEKAWRERNEAEARISYSRGLTDYEYYQKRMLEIERVYNALLLERTDLSTDERLKLQADYWEAVNKNTKYQTTLLIEEENDSYNKEITRLREALADKLEEGTLSAEERKHTEEVYTEAVELAELEHLRRLVELTKEGTEDRLKAEQQYLDARLKAAQRHQQKYEEQQSEHERKLASFKDKYFGLNAEEKQAAYGSDFAALTEVYNAELLAAGNNAEEKLRIEEAYQQAKLALQRQYGLLAEEDTRNSMQKAVASSVDWLNGEGGQALTGTLSTLTSGMSSIFSGLSTLIQAELEIQTSKIERRYNREIELAQGNSYKVAKLEKRKEKEIAKVKNDANKKMFAMQVIQAVAQTAQNALSAYGSAAAIPVVGYILAPIAAAMAVAAGAIQIASIKKQQQASEAQGYSQGGFTRPGAVDEPAGIVHAGEWVASQKLLANPVARPMIEALDYAQRTNTIGSLRPDDVSRSITANDSLVRMAEGDGSSALMVAAAVRMSQTVDTLTDRLNEPFVTVNTVVGDKGIKQAQDEYSRLMDNVTPKSKRK
jgi:TP901 family phage tail tape measure protein